MKDSYKSIIIAIKNNNNNENNVKTVKMYLVTIMDIFQ